MATASSSPSAAPATASTAAAASSATTVTPATVKQFVGEHGGIDNATVGALLQVHGALSEMLDLIKLSMGPRGAPAATTKAASSTAAPAATSGTASPAATSGSPASGSAATSAAGQRVPGEDPRFPHAVGEPKAGGASTASAPSGSNPVSQTVTG